MKNSPVRDVGVELMRFWSSPATAEKWVRYTKSPTGLSGSLYDSEYGMDSLADFQRRLISGRNLQPDILFFKEDDSPISPIGDYFYPIIRGEMSADEALTKMKTTDE